MPTGDGAVRELTIEQGDAVLPGLARFVADGGPPPHDSFVPSSERRNDQRSNAGWGALVLAALGVALVPVSLANASGGGAGWYGVIGVWALGVIVAARKWLVLRRRRGEAPRDGLFLLPAALLRVAGSQALLVPAAVIRERGVQPGPRAGTCLLRVRTERPDGGRSSEGDGSSTWTSLGALDLDATELDDRLQRWALRVT